MVSLTMMARLVEAVRPDARLVLVGDPDQLASVEAGAVLADLVVGLAPREPKPGGAAGDHAPVRRGDRRAGRGAARRGRRRRARRAASPGRTRSSSSRPTTRPPLLQAAAGRGRGRGAAARRGRATPHDAVAALDRHRLLCAHRDGPFGVTALEPAGRALAVRGDRGPAVRADVRRPAAAGDRQRLRARRLQRRRRRGREQPTADRARSIAGARGWRDFATSRMSDVETMFATTIHKSQGSQATR